MPANFNFVATGIGSLPFVDSKEACELIFAHMEEAPHWPQLPKASAMEGMIEQFLEGAPGVVQEGGRTYLRPLEPYEEWARFYAAYEGAELEAFAISTERAQGFYTFLEELGGRQTPPFIKGQVTGPITLGLTLREKGGAVAFFHPDLRDMLVKLVTMKAKWQQQTFQRLFPQAQVIIFFDEPILSGYGSAFMNVSRDDVISTLQEAISPLGCLKGVHICGNTDWPMIMEVGFDIIDFDAYNYLSSFLLYHEELKGFLAKGGAVGWGIVPTDEGALKGEDAPSLTRRLKEGIEEIIKWGVAPGLLTAQSLITPSCGAGSLNEGSAQRVYELTAEVTVRLR